MSDRRLAVTYTSQLHKKSPTFKDGFLVVTEHGRCRSLFDSANRSSPVEVWRQSSAGAVEPGEELTFERHLIRVDPDQHDASASAPALPPASSSSSSPSPLSARPSSFPLPLPPSRVSLARPRAPLHPNAPARPTAVAAAAKAPRPSDVQAGQGPSKRARVEPLWTELPSTTAPGLAKEAEPAVPMYTRQPLKQLHSMQASALRATPPSMPAWSAQRNGWEEEEDDGEIQDVPALAMSQLNAAPAVAAASSAHAWLQDEDEDDGEVLLTQPSFASQPAGPAANSRTTAADLLAILAGHDPQHSLPAPSAPPPPPPPPPPPSAPLPARVSTAFTAPRADAYQRQPLPRRSAHLGVQRAPQTFPVAEASTGDEPILRTTPPSASHAALLSSTPPSPLTPASGGSHSLAASPPSPSSLSSLSFHSLSHSPNSSSLPLPPLGPSHDRKPAFPLGDDEDAPLTRPPPRVDAERENRQPVKSPTEYRALAAACRPSRPASASPPAPSKFSDSFMAPLHYTPRAGVRLPRSTTKAPTGRAAPSTPLPTLRFVAGPSTCSSSLTLPDTFTSLPHYQSAFTAALLQQINMALAETAKKFTSALALWRTQRESPRGFSTPLYPSSGAQTTGKELSRQQQDFFRSHKVPYYRSDALQLSAVTDKRNKKKKEWPQWQKKKKAKRGRNAQHADDADADHDPPSDASDDDKGDGDGECCWLFLVDPSSREKGSSKDDLFILSNQPLFGAGAGERPGLWVMFALTLYRAFSLDGGMMKVRLMGCEGHKPTIRSRTSVYAIRGPSLNTEAAMLTTLSTLSFASLPILPCLLHGAAWQDAERGVSPADGSSPTSFSSLIAALHIPPELIARTRLAVIEDFHLNSDQVDVLDRCVDWFRPPSPSSPSPSPIVLVHGAFGAGKSVLLVALLVFFHRLLTPLDPHNKVRILVASMTNVAVDGLLSSLLHRGYSWFMRVGSTKKIAQNILRYTVFESGGGKGIEEQHKHMQAEVKAKLDEAVKAGEDEAAIRELRDVLAEMDKEKGRDRKRRLMSQRVVGVTCAASTFDVLDGSVFPLVFLDESSQMIEPASLVPLARFHCQRLIAVGDPKQLSPNLFDVEGTASTTAVASCLKKAMFERLAFADVPCVLLRHQYRMHPTLMQLPNRLFYDGLLLNGVQAEDRPPLLVAHANVNERSLPPLSFVNVAHGREQSERMWDGSLSCSNHAEVAAVVALVSALLRKGVPASSIGLITMYRAQWKRLREEVAKLVVTLDEEAEQRRAMTAAYTTGKGSLVVDDAGLLPHSEWKGAGVSGSGVQVNTVDSFQGGEKDVVILCTVKTSVTDFMDNARRINVALTRARHHLVIVGHQPTLLQSPLWKQVVTHISCSLPGCFYPNPAGMAGLMDRCALNSVAVLVSETDSSAHVRASQSNSAAGRRKKGQPRVEKQTEGGNKRKRGKKTEQERAEEAEERLRLRRAAAVSDSDEEQLQPPQLHDDDDESHPIDEPQPSDEPHWTPPSCPPPTPHSHTHASSSQLIGKEREEEKKPVEEGEDDEDAPLTGGATLTRAVLDATLAVVLQAERVDDAGASVDVLPALPFPTQVEEGDGSEEGKELAEPFEGSAAPHAPVTRARRRIVEEEEEAEEEQEGNALLDPFAFL